MAGSDLMKLEYVKIPSLSDECQPGTLLSETEAVGPSSTFFSLRLATGMYLGTELWLSTR